MYFTFWWNWKGYLQQTVIPLPYAIFATDLRIITICLYKRIYLILEILIILDNHQPFKLVWWCSKLKKLFVRLDCMHSDKYVILMEFDKLVERFYEKNRVYLWARTECRRNEVLKVYTSLLLFLSFAIFRITQDWIFLWNQVLQPLFSFWFIIFLAVLWWNK